MAKRVTRLGGLLAAYQRRDPAARSKLEIFLLYPGVHAVLYHRVAHWLYRHHRFFLARCVSQWSRFWTGIEIHPGARIGRRVFIDHGMGVVIGETAEVGDDCTLYHGVTLGGTSLAEGTKRHPTLEPNVIVGAGAKVLGAFTVGEGARIGSNAVVVKPVAAGATIVGVPGRQAGENKPDAAKRFEAYAVEKSDDPYSVAIKELVRVTHEQNAVIEKLSEQIRELGGKGVEDIPKVNVGNIGVSTRRARHHRQKKKAVETPQDPQS